MNVNRRTLVLGSAAAARALYGQDAQVKTAVIGTGNRGSHLLQGVLQQPVAKVVAVCDIKPDRLDKAASAAAKDNPTTYTDWRKIIDRKDVDAVYVATPPHLHSEMAIAALEAGKHVYCEKPIGVTAAQVKALYNVARKSKKVFIAGQQMRTQKSLASAVKKIHEGAVGDIMMVRAQRHATSDMPKTASSADWYFEVTKSGGYLIEQSVHNLDCCNWVVNAHPVKCCGFGGTLMYKNEPPGRNIFDHGCMVFEYASGAKMVFTQNVFHPRGMPIPNQIIHVFGKKGAVDLLYSANMYPAGRDEKPSQLAEREKEDQHAHTVAFFNSILHNAPNPADIVVGTTGALTAIMGHEAMTREKVILWSEFGINV
jgi:predicted dehydrogenase